MRHMMILAAATAAVVSFAGPAAAQKKSTAPPAAAAAKGAPNTPAPPPISLDRVAGTVGLDAATRAKVAPHVAAMNTQVISMREITARTPKDAPKAEQERAHKELNAYYAVFQKHWDEARGLVPPAKQAAFDAAIRAEMSGGRRVGNPHSKLPAAHPKLNAQGGKAK